jgi:hypothetical protein
MSAIKGTWKINSVGDVTGVIEQEVNCTSGGVSFKRIQVFTGYVALHHDDSAAVYMVFNNGVLDETYQNLDFGDTEQEVTDEFYAWLTANAEQVEETEPEDPGTEDPEDPDTGDTGDTEGGDTEGGDTESGDTETGGSGDTEGGDTDPVEPESPGLYISEMEMKDGTVYAIKDAEAREAIQKLNETIPQQLETIQEQLDTDLAAMKQEIDEEIPAKLDELKTEIDTDLVALKEEINNDIIGALEGDY